MIGEPTKDDEPCSCDGANSEDKELRIMLCDSADGVARERWIMFKIL